MSEINKKFFIRTLILSIILVLIYIIIELVFKAKVIASVFPWLLLFFLVFYNLSFLLLSRFAIKSFRTFLNLNMILTFVKLILLMALVITYVVFIRQEILKFIMTFFVLYLVFTALEVGSIVPEVKKNRRLT